MAAAAAAAQTVTADKSEDRAEAVPEEIQVAITRAQERPDRVLLVVRAEARRLPIARPVVVVVQAVLD